LRLAGNLDRDPDAGSVLIGDSSLVVADRR